MTIDFNPPSKRNSPGAPRRWRLWLMLLIPTCLATALLFALLQPPAEVPTAAHPPAVPKVSAPEAAAPQPAVEIVAGTVRPGDTITGLLKDFFSPQEIHALNQQSKKIFPLSKICAGQPFKLCLEDQILTQFEYDIDREDQLIIRRQDDGFDITRVPIPYTTTEELVRGRIDSNLFEAVAASGESAELAMALADIFAWDIDFIRDIRSGDSFQALVEKRFRDGEPAGYGRILAAAFTNQGRTFPAILFADGERRAAYYDAEGRSLRKAFLRAPLDFSRISSGFSLRRFHPITKTWKAHPAIDYAAPTGTPIKTVGDGVISQIGHTKYNGNYIKIRHNSNYETLYLHMNSFAKGMKQGKRLQQGEVIGYVGSTGLATGPHLCFRMYKNGSPVNPNQVRSAAAPSVSNQNLPAFRALATPLLARFETGQQDAATQLAAVDGERP